MRHFRHSETLEKRPLAANPGDVLHGLFDPVTQKHKYYLCLTYELDFVYLNSPKDSRYQGDFYIGSEHIRFLKPTKDRFSVVSCNNLIRMTERQFNEWAPTLVGNIDLSMLAKVIHHMTRLPTIKPKDAARLAEDIKTVGKFVKSYSLSGRRRG